MATKTRKENAQFELKEYQEDSLKKVGGLYDEREYDDCCLSVLRSLRSRELVIFYFDDHKWQLLQEQLEKWRTWRLSTSVEVSLLDKTGERIGVASYKLSEPFVTNNSSWGVVKPHFSHVIWVATIVRLGRLTPEDIRDIDTITVEVVVSKDN